MEQAEEREKGKTPEELKQEQLEHEKRAKELLQDLENARMEGKNRDDQSVVKLENSMRELLQISTDTWISQDNSLEELISKLKTRHEMISGQLQVRACLTEGQMLQKVSGGRALQ